MDSTLVNIATRTLKHHGVPVCIVGELARNYYNVLRVCHDLEICVPETSSLVAAGLLCSTRLFEPWVHDGNFNNYTEYKRGIMYSYRLVSTGKLDDIATLRLPRLVPPLKDMASRYLNAADDVAMIAAEQLVDDMNL
ncbi:hypothetical protein DCS_06417 [Drechmeria coniospora]|uniref:Uncharacterized protein n=1 Tax=Drechmeria coniospora TaxID=98403 RepID=A0A151GBH2_DRECN|nr:hypothetical protein DCS_06417 [Drechmeria coniospora]KYK54459.1 hypothetical protein DCS_06417 [Drechmeria coniospora]